MKRESDFEIYIDLPYLVASLQFSLLPTSSPQLRLSHSVNISSHLKVKSNVSIKILIARMHDSFSSSSVTGDLRGSHGFKVEVTQKWSPELLVEILRFPPTQRWSNIMVRVWVAVISDKDCFCFGHILCPIAHWLICLIKRNLFYTSK